MAASTRAKGTVRPKKTVAQKAADKAVTDFDIDSKIEELEALADQKVVNDDGSINVVEIGRSGRTPNPVIDLFTLNGKTYTIPSRPSAALMQRFLRDVRQKGSAHASAVLLDTMIGPEALDALAESNDVTDEDMAAIYTAVTHVCFGRFAKRGKHASDPS